MDPQLKKHKSNLEVLNVRVIEPLANSQLQLGNTCFGDYSYPSIIVHSSSPTYDSKNIMFHIVIGF